MNSIPICLVTGFLGAGKTTTLRHLADRYSDRKIVYLVNEFSDIDIDGVVLDDHADVVSIPGGSIFCKCLIVKFLSHLKQLPETYPGIEGVVIEASGMADPMVIEKMLAETGLDRVYHISSIITIVDSGSYLKLRHTLPTIVSQVRAADIVLMNKCDVYDGDVLDRAESAILEDGVTTAILRTMRGRLEIDVFETICDFRHLEGDYALCRDPDYSAGSLAIEDEIDLDMLRDVITQRGEDLYRVKGHVRSRGQLHYIDWSASGFDSRPVGYEPEKFQLAVIGRGDRSPVLEL